MYRKGVKGIQTQIKRESKSFEAIQQGSVIAVLNTLGFVITEVFFKGQPLCFGKKIDKYVDEQFQTEIVADMSLNQIKSLKRRRDLNRAALSFNWLVEYLEQLGYTVERRPTKSAKKTLQMEKVSKISEKNGYIITLTEMQTIGKEVNSYVISQFIKLEKTTVLREYHPLCFDLLYYSNINKNNSIPYCSLSNNEIKHQHKAKIENENSSDTITLDECISTPTILLLFYYLY
ncbi:hypothetical protein CL6EHI_118390 [Entamoeba histolytica]|uniref:Uncharacterized protein n=1 Tax=Entamoeba histolytica TaxID=5759 RepID=A0A175JKE7_ENTHI|nr:hypothetical protein CL6EHI_118390 [Entamoeba histolytica]